jgi:hypothetical protein
MAMATSPSMATTPPTISTGTSKLEHATADVLNNAKQVTVCCWIYPNGLGEFGNGAVIYLDEQAGNAAFVIAHLGANMLLIEKYPGTAGVQGSWTVPIIDRTWNAVCIRLDFSADNAPTARVNFTTVSVTTDIAPVGINDQPATGYCVGNNTAQTRTWDGRIAHVQLFNTILTDANADAALRNPGSVTAGRRLHLPMSKANDTNDISGLGFHGTGTDLANGSNTPPLFSIFHFGPTNYTLKQIVIPSNANEPAEGVIGLGTRTRLTESGGLTGGSRFITTDNWFSGGVIEPTVKDVYVYGAKGVANHPYVSGSEATAPAGPHAIDLDGDAAQVVGCKVFDFRGDGIAVRDTKSPGQRQSRMILVPLVRNNRISHTWTGIRVVASDTQLYGNTVANVRDNGLLVEAGNCQSEGNHFFGAKRAIKVQANAGAFRSVNDTFSDAEIGFENALESEVSQIGDGFTQHCWNRNILCRAQTSIANTVVRVANTSENYQEIIGVEYPRDMNGNASRSSFIGGCLYLSDHLFSGQMIPNGSTAGMKVDAWWVNVDTTIIGSGNYGNEKGIWVPTAITGGNFYIRAAGFEQSGDVIVDIDSAGIKETTWVIECGQGDDAVNIPVGWDHSNSITVVRQGGEKTYLIPGKAY